MTKIISFIICCLLFWVAQDLVSCLSLFELVHGLGCPSRVPIGMILESDLPERFFDVLDISERRELEVRVVVPCEI